MPAQNPMYDALEERISMVQILRDGEEIFYGEVREIKESIEKVKSVYCIGELAFLFDSVQPQERYQNITPEQLFIKMLDIHNSKVEEKKRFYAGIVTVKDSNDSVYRFTNGEDTLTAIRKKLCEPLGGYLRIRKEDGKRYLDLVPLEEYGISAEQPIQFGRNLLKYNSKRSGANIATVCVPRGAKLDTQVVEGLDAYVDIKSVNDDKDYVINQAAYETYGWIEKVVEWSDVTVPENLLTKAQNWVDNNQYRVLSLELKAVDLAELNANLSPYKVGDMIRAIAEPFGLDMWFPLQKKITYINDSITNDVTLSYNAKVSYTSQQSNNLQDVGNAIPQETALLERAKFNASKMLTNASKGYIYDVYDEEGNRVEQLIMDTKDINTAQKVWRWNANGFGYSKNGIDGPYELAMTMDGAIVADMITTGILRSIEINNGDGAFTVDENGNVIANSLKSNNAEITGGSFKMIKSSFDYDVFMLESDDYIINFTSNSLEVFDKSNKEFVKVGPIGGLHLGTFEGTPHSGDGSYLYGRSSYGDNARIRGDLYVTGTTTLASSPVISSDRSLKDEVAELDLQKATDFVYSLKPCEFKYKNGTSNRLHHGLIAQEVKESMGDDDWGVYIDSAETNEKGVRYEELIADLIATVQTQNERIKALEGRGDE